MSHLWEPSQSFDNGCNGFLCIVLVLNLLDTRKKSCFISCLLSGLWTHAEARWNFHNLINSDYCFRIQFLLVPDWLGRKQGLIINEGYSVMDGVLLCLHSSASVQLIIHSVCAVWLYMCLFVIAFACACTLCVCRDCVVLWVVSLFRLSSNLSVWVCKC